MNPVVLVMDEESFRSYLKQNKKSESATKQIIDLVKEFESYLSDEGLEAAVMRTNDLDDFVLWIERSKKKANKHLWAITIYYQYLKDEKLAKHASSLRGKKIKRKPFPIGSFRGVNPDYVKNLNESGIENVEQMIQKGKTPANRRQLAEETNIPIESILEFVKLSDLTRLGAVKTVRARLYYHAGIDTIEKMAQFDPTKLRAFLVEWIKTSGFDGIAPLPREAANAVEAAKRLPKIVVYE